MDDAQNTPGTGPADTGAQPAFRPPPQEAPSGRHSPSGASAPPPGPGPKPQGPAPDLPATGTPLPSASAVDAVTPGVPAVPEPETGGKTAIAEQAVAKVAALAARSVPGVYTLGTGAGRTLGAVRDAVAGSDTSATTGVHVEAGETEAAVDITLVAEYGTPLTGVADAVRAAVYRAVEDLVGLNVVEVNVSVADVHIPEAMDSRGTRRQPGGSGQD